MGRSSALWGAEFLDLPGVGAVIRPRTRAELPVWEAGQAFLAGGSWLFSEPQPGLRGLVDLVGLGWPALEVSEAGLRIGATCTIAALERFEGPGDWGVGRLFGECSRALLGSFKIWAVATVGGNVCLALPASPMLALTVALEGVARVWIPGGGERAVPMAEFAVGAQRTMLAPGEVLRAIDLPVRALRGRAAMRQASLTRYGRSAALVVGTVSEGGFGLTVTAATGRPMRWDWVEAPGLEAVDGVLAALPGEAWYDDVHGTPAWRRHMTRRLAAEVYGELLG